ncbi:MAG: anaerobic ribonucleoside triphosphate reductase [Clostridia bacterium]|nr:anaerobic ribonucleoside triphosphate reductase [Clostridia bacterium]MBR2327081.1 anaerobic ribonucleoside triphosphate reductase [Clostridia bacterium]
MLTTITKRDGRNVTYDRSKIAAAIDKAMTSCNRKDTMEAERLALIVEEKLMAKFIDSAPGVEDVQDTVEATLMENGYAYVAKKYILYRAERTRSREMNSKLMRIYDELTFIDAGESDMKRDNANIDGDTAMGTMLKYGSEGAKDYYEKYILTEEQSKAHKSGDIHIHDFDFYTLTTTCCQIDLLELFKGGFSTGHGFLREPADIASYAALACIAIQANQNDQHGGQSVPNFDFSMAPGVRKTYKRLYATNLGKAIELLCPAAGVDTAATKAKIKEIEDKKGLFPSLEMTKEYLKEEKAWLSSVISDADMVEKVKEFAVKATLPETEKAVYQAMEALVHNLNTMHSRAGAQTPFSSINYGTDTSPEGRMVIKYILKATEDGLGFGETAIFPIHIFKIKEGVNYNPEDKNYDLMKYACKVTAKRLFPNFSFIDAPFNLQYYKPGHPETEVSYMGCRTRVIGNFVDPSKQITYGRGNLSFTSINLPRIAIRSNKNIEWFFDELENKMKLVSRQLIDRYRIVAKKKVKNFPFLMGQGIWINSKGLKPEDNIGEILKHGTLSIGFIGLAETLVALTGHHHGETQEARNLGLEIVGFMRDMCEKFSREYGMNFTLLATPAEGLSGRFIRIDKKKYGIIAGVTDREYYTNSFHVPVYYNIPIYDKIKIEAPYHALTNAGHITYVELDGDAANNVETIEKIVRIMKEAGIGYGSINHPVDRDPVCGYNGIIGDECPKCHRKEDDGSGYGFERIRRITGYLVGTLDRFNDAKRAEERDRVKHGLPEDCK